MNSFRLTFITPLFSKGTYDEVPEVRPPSIRGQLHWWFRSLGGSPSDEKGIFGGVQGRAQASRVVIRVGGVDGSTGKIATLPHKSGGPASPKHAFRPETSFELYILQRLGGLDERLTKAFVRTLETWLLLGTLGLRSTRAAGSFYWQSLSAPELTAPTDFASYELRCRELLKGAPLRFALLDESFEHPEEARRVVSDTLGGRDDTQGENDLAQIRHPLGKVFKGRKTSPLRFRIVGFDNTFRIAAIWDDRQQVTGNQPGDLTAIIDLLNRSGKPIGRMLSSAQLH